MKKFNKGLIFTAIFSCLLWFSYAAVDALETSQPAEITIAALSPAKEHKKINRNIVDYLKHRHYLKVVINDQLSSKVLYRYLDELDPNHSYFYDKDIKEFEIKYRFRLDYALNAGNLEPAFDIFNRYQQRVAFVSETLSGLLL